MKGDHIKYEEGYKYQLHEAYHVQIGIRGHTVLSEWYTLSLDGWLTIFRGYAWDGATGVPDDAHIMRGSLVHDVLYQMMREGQLPQDCFHAANDELANICVEDGMSHLRADLVRIGVNAFGSPAAAVQPEKIFTAP